MTGAVLDKLLAIFGTVALGWIAGRARWLGPRDGVQDPARVLGNAAFYIFVPALLFRTTARLDLRALPWATQAAFFVPALALLFAVYGAQRWRQRGGHGAAAAPSVRAVTAVFGNSVQVGIPMALALFGDAGLAIHLTIVGLHALVLLSVTTALAELDLAHAHAAHADARSLARTLAATARNTLIHPVVLPVVAGLLWNAAGLALPPLAQEVLQLLGSAVVPLCLVLIGLSLAYYGLQGQARNAIVLALIKLLVMPGVVLVVAHWGFGLTGLPLSVVVMLAALPTGSNALLFAQRYGVLAPEAAAATVVSTCAFVATAPLWLAVLARL